MVRPNLLVILSRDIDHAVRFYEAIGLTFHKHSHGRGAEHYASESDGFVFELYPEDPAKGSSLGTRLGFSVDSVDEVVAVLEQLGATIVTPPRDSPWGRRAVVDDFDGHRVELLAAVPVRPE